ncbi:MAG: hypothetical protein ACREHG_07400 [Candidatus Saccharimonadales bacterium]
MVNALLNRDQVRELSRVHGELAALHARVNQITVELYSSEGYELATDTLDAQLAITDAMAAVHKAMYPEV